MQVSFFSSCRSFFLIFFQKCVFCRKILHMRLALTYFSQVQVFFPQVHAIAELRASVFFSRRFLPAGVFFPQVSASWRIFSAGACQQEGEQSAERWPLN